jgi:signal transduction histidine kinase
MTSGSKINLLKRRKIIAVALLLLALATYPLVTIGYAQPKNTKDGPDALSVPNNPLDLLGAWIWTTNTFDGQSCQFWRALDIPADLKVVSARVLLTADNEFTFFLDGRQLGHGAEWRELFDYNLVLLLSPGRHVLAVSTMNPSGFAGMLFGMKIDFANGASMEIKSDPSWKIVSEEDKSWKEMARPSPNWTSATVVATLGGKPWWTEPVRINSMLTPTPIKIYFWQTVWFQIVFLTLCGIGAVTIFVLAAQLTLHRKERWLLQRERARIAMDVHDDIGSRMTHLVLNGEVAQGEVPVDSRARAQLEQICDEARGVLSSIDEILWALNPRRDTLQDFADYVCDYTQKFLAPTSIACVFEVDTETLDAVADLPLRRSLLMVIKETLNNAIKYSEATELHLQIGRQKHNLVVVVADNGKGFDMLAIRPGARGVGNMSKRMQELGGSCRITSQVGKGCRIEFCIPLRRPRNFSRLLPWRSK